jgi:hypothetical protein
VDRSGESGFAGMKFTICHASSFAWRRLLTPPPPPQEIDRVYKINKMRGKKINPDNLVNPVYFHCFSSEHRPLKSRQRSVVFWNDNSQVM